MTQLKMINMVLRKSHSSPLPTRRSLSQAPFYPNPMFKQSSILHCIVYCLYLCSRLPFSFQNQLPCIFSLLDQLYYQCMRVESIFKSFIYLRHTLFSLFSVCSASQSCNSRPGRATVLSTDTSQANATAGGSIMQLTAPVPTSPMLFCVSCAEASMTM